MNSTTTKPGTPTTSSRVCALVAGAACLLAPAPWSLAMAAPPTPAPPPVQTPTPAAGPAPADVAPPPTAAPPSAGVPAPPPSSAPPVEPEPVAPEPVAPGPVAPEPVGPEPAPAEPLAPEPPSEPTTPEPSDAPPPHFGETNLDAFPPSIEGPRPRPGTGQVVGGGILVGTGALNMIGGALLLAARDGAPSPEARDLADSAGKAGLIIGSVYVVGGAVLLYTGTRSRRRYREWVHRNHLSPPKPGNGMLVGGGVLAGSALLDIGIAAALGSGNALSYTLDGLQLGAAVVLLAIGGVRRARYGRWLTNRGLSWTPNLAPQRGGATAGVSGRF